MALPQPSIATLPDGRTLAFNEFGDPDGFPIIYNHHWLGSRLDAVPLHRAAARAGVRLICPDRPGFGYSEPHDDRTLIGWAADVHALTRTIGVDRYSAVGWSGGAPSTIACAFALGQYVKRVGIVSGFGPLFVPRVASHLPAAERSVIRLARRGSLASRAAMSLLRRRSRKGGAEVELIPQLSDADAKELRDNPQLSEQLAASRSEAFRQGVTGPTSDLQLMVRPWGFELDHISTEVLMWHGTDDAHVGVEHALEYQRTLLNPRLKLFDGHGHLVFFTDAAGMLSALKAEAPITPS